MCVLRRLRRAAVEGLLLCLATNAFLDHGSTGAEARKSKDFIDNNGSTGAEARKSKDFIDNNNSDLIEIVDALTTSSYITEVEAGILSMLDDNDIDQETSTIFSSSRRSEETVTSTINTNGDNSSKMRRVPRTLSVQDLLVSSLMILVVSGIMRCKVGLVQLSSAVLVAAIRCALQLLLVGAVLLKFIFSHNTLPLVSLWIVVSGALTSMESYGRLEHTYRKLEWHIASSLFLGCGVVLAVLLVGVLHVHPLWWDAATVIPIAGMIFGNVLSVFQLGLNSLLEEFTVGRDRLEYRLARGGTFAEVSLPIMRKALQTSLTTTVNSMAVMGLISIPGMMSGQLLGGQDPEDAAAYQIMIMFAICSACCLSMSLLSRLVLRTLFHSHLHMLATTEETGLSIKIKQSITSGFKCVFCSPTQEKNCSSSDSTSTTTATSIDETFPLLNDMEEMSYRTLEAGHKSKMPTLFSPEAVLGKDGHPKRKGNDGTTSILVINNLHIPRAAKPTKISFTLKPGDRIGITGPSGFGKTMLIRAVTHLAQPSPSSKEEDAEGSQNGMTLNGVSYKDMPMNQWRSQVMWVPQDRPTEAGTPQDLLANILEFESFRGFKVRNRPEDISKDWGLDPSIYGRPWTTLSGGECQRASLALSIALEPTVLLLDEPTSACDGQTALAMEETLRKLSTKIPILMISHDRAQVDRFCTHHLRLS
jgi:putative ABC transport system permease protein